MDTNVIARNQDIEKSILEKLFATNPKAIGFANAFGRNTVKLKDGEQITGTVLAFQLGNEFEGNEQRGPQPGKVFAAIQTDNGLVYRVGLDEYTFRALNKGMRLTCEKTFAPKDTFGNDRDVHFLSVVKIEASDATAKESAAAAATEQTTA